VVIEVPLEKKWKTMQDICRGFHFTWRKIVSEEFGPEKARKLILKFWEKTGEETGKLYLMKSKVDPEDVSTVAKAIVVSSLIMDEDAQIAEASKEKAIIRTIRCPWWEWFRKLGIAGEECKDGCDIWYESMLRVINPGFENLTTKASPLGDEFCEHVLTKRYSKRH